MATTKSKVTTQPAGNVDQHAPEQPKFKVKRNITLPLIKPAIDVPVYIKVTSTMFIGKDIKKPIGGKVMEPATLVNCVNLETGEEAQIIVPSVLSGIFEDEFPEQSYVNKGFQITKHAKGNGKAYHPFSVAELEL